MNTEDTFKLLINFKFKFFYQKNNTANIGTSNYVGKTSVVWANVFSFATISHH